MADGEEDPAVFSCRSLPADPRLMATVTNAYLGTRVFRDILHVGGVYSGAGGDTHRADIPSPANVRVTVPGVDSLAQTFSLNTRTGTFSHVLQSTDFTATHQIYAHQSLVHLLVSSITIQRSAPTTQPITVQLQTPFVPKSQDLDLKQGPDFQGAHYIYGRTLVPEVEGGPRPTIHMLWRPVPPALTLRGEERERCWEFLTAVAESREEVQRSYSEGVALGATGSLRAAHLRGWAELWRGCCVELDGPLPLRQALHGCLYYLLSTVPPRDSPGFLFQGISPGGLSNGTRGEDYWGHVFWDQDTWMFPNILLFYPEAARAILEYRLRTLDGALCNAREQGYQGAKFPWESAATGREVCPEEIYGAQEIHVTGDVLMAFEQYYCTTQDQKLFREDGGWQLVGAVAQYWCSRMEWSEEEQCYHIKGVMPPDEYHCRVDNSVYTNAVARRSLDFAADVARDFLVPVPEQWLDCAKRVKVPFDAEKKYHPEYDGYSPGEPVKQADVVLLGFPLMHPMSPEVRRNDLEVYEPVTERDGPAMTWSMFAVGWLELKEVQRAQSQLNKCFSNITEPFKIWVENSDGSGAVNFLTGMGGFLQAVLFGYTGFRITRPSLRFDPALPEDVNKLEVTGVSYLSNKLKFTITKGEIRVQVTEAPQHPLASPLEVVLEGSGQHFPLREGQIVSFPTAAGWIQRSSTHASNLG
ncbi:protein-glucosylgalactosylhydroxylysine glucosidase [Apus apus]|uniref:protein-glucosylgalactosylhydroxylysine glucosidase n=1 Tax=Apus apus TaxID=8895 RepID=UPI0021F916D5|nr:protein-glucosylgalactosylhydroxylysine glucosidase [Apus apus]XP_051477785.1 protein-glucosylgalactosylhydroxylysine glucosidase [Apus apus]XP_051477786.1 protein-glucosylgalactosylhydroxylysine glucosidase [Apus apus]XP_051477787.1 protein-glucosylgalactosylhydroxylysine glucosidase [Apus apus]XP_051477788.1 protein-glucosylgalactosylhydroxylysine glucosidase [Apus apus]